MKLNNTRSFVRNVFAKKSAYYLVAFFAGIVGAAPYFCENAFVLTFLSYIAFFSIIIVRHNENKGVFWASFLYFFGFHFPVYLFLSELYPYERFGFNGGEATLVLIASCLLIPLYHSLLKSLVLLFIKLIPGEKWLPTGFCAVWLCTEWITSIGTLAFPWAGTAVSLTGFLPYVQTASLFGQYFIAGVTVLICFELAHVIVLKTEVRKKAIIASLLFTCNTLAGTVFYFVNSNDGTGNSTKAALLQGNVLSNEKWVSGKQGEIFDKYISLATDAAENGAKVIVFPESAIPIGFSENGMLHKSFADLANKYEAAVIAGISLNEGGTAYNSVVGVTPGGALTARYDKRHPVPFGEFIPYAEVIGKLFPFVAEFNESSTPYGKGEGSVVVKTPYGAYGPLVCFDSIFPRYAADSAKNGALALVIVTNDSWFNDSEGIYVHLRHAKLRAIETGKYVLRAANTGISAFIKPNGQISVRSNALEECVLYGDIQLRYGNTLYTYIRDVPLYAAFAAITAFIIIKIIRRIKNGTNSTSQNRDI